MLFIGLSFKVSQKMHLVKKSVAHELSGTPVEHYKYATGPVRASKIFLMQLKVLVLIYKASLV